MTDCGLTLPCPAGGEAALAVTLDWLRAANEKAELGTFVLDPLDVSGAPDTLAERMERAGLRDWRDAIVAGPRSGQPLQLKPHLSWLMGRVALEVALGMDHPGFFRTVEQFMILGGVTDANLASAVCSRILDAPEDYSLLERLHNHLQILWNSRSNEQLRRYAEATATRLLTSRDLWPEHGTMAIGDGWAHRVSAALWPDLYMQMLAGFPAQFQHGLVEPLLPLDMGLVASLIEASPGAFSTDGAPVGPVVVFALLSSVETHFATIDVQNLSDSELGLGRVLDSLFLRTDGEWIARAWLQEIIWRDIPRRAGRAQANVNAQRALMDALLVRLSCRITPLGEAAFDWVSQEGALWRVNRVLSEASILEAHDDAMAAAEIMAGAIKRGLVCATGRPAGLLTGSPEATIVARVLSRLPDMKNWFEQLWIETYELREHLSYSAYRDLDNPAYPALAWSLIGLNSSEATSVDTGEFWRAIGAAVFETQRIDPNACLFNGAMLPITRVTVQLGAALTEKGLLEIGDFASFMADQLEPTAEYSRLWQIARMEASDDVALAGGRMIGSDLVRQAIEAGLAQPSHEWDRVLSQSERDDLSDFSHRL